MVGFFYLSDTGKRVVPSRFMGCKIMILLCFLLHIVMLVTWFYFRSDYKFQLVFSVVNGIVF